MRDGKKSALGIKSLLGYLAVPVLTIVAASEAMAVDWKTVANSASAIPGTSGKLFSSFGQPSLNNKCAIAFRGRSTGPGEPARGVYAGNGCNLKKGLGVFAFNGTTVPQPNNLAAEFTEFPAFPRLDLRSNLAATRGQSKPVWEYTLPDGSDTRVGTSGVYAGLIGSAPLTGASLLGAVPGFEQYSVPGYPGVRFDQFPGAPAVYDGNKIAFKGNFTDGLVSRTGIFIRNLYLDRGKSLTRRIADTQTTIPGTTALFGSTAPPSAADGAVVFAGFDNEEAPTLGGIYRAAAPKYVIKPLVTIGQAAPDTPSLAFTKFGEALSFDGQNIGFWAALGTESRTIRVHCPADGNADIVAACKDQCPATDADGNYCEQQVPVEQGLYVYRPNGTIRLVARAGVGQAFKDFLFWTFSGRPPGVGESDAEDFEPPRWRSSAFIATSRNGGSVANAFKAVNSGDVVGVYMKPTLQKPAFPKIVVGDDAALVDPAAPPGAKVASVGLEREGLRKCVLAVNAGFLNETTSASWAGVYTSSRNVCRTPR